MKKRLFSILLALVLCLSLLPMSAFAVSYSDIEGHWAEDAIVRWSDYGMIQGSNGQFRPYGTLTRAHMATMLARLLDLPEAKSAGFSDTAGHWAEDAIDRCAAAGILLGDGGKADPDAPITRQQAMTMLCRALQYRKDAATALNAFADADKVSGYAAGYMAALVNDGVVLGNKGKLDPLSYINRGQMVAIIDRLIGYYANVNGQTISAKNGGLILVVAKNVKITDAPAYTTVVVGKDAAGLKVNGVAVAAGATYVVPAGKPASSSSTHTHSHTYAEAWSFDDDCHWHAATCGHDVVSDKAEHDFGENSTDVTCSVCGAKNTAFVATVNGVGYATLAEAFAVVSSAAQNSTHTIEILKDIELSSWTAVSANYKNITINGNGHTITGLTDSLISRVGPAAISVKDLTFDAVSIAKTGSGYANKGYAALIGYCDFSGGGSVTVDNCHVTNSSFDVYQWAGAFVGATDIPQEPASITIKNSSVSNTSFKVEDGSCGAFVGYTCTGVTVENSQVLGNCSFECTEDRNGGTAKAGSVIGTISHGKFVLNNVTVADAVTVTNKNATPLVDDMIGRMFNNAMLTIDGKQIVADGVLLNAAGEYEISNKSGMFWLAQNTFGDWFLGKTIKLTADIDLENAAWTPLGNSTTQFNGTFDGQGHTIKNLKIEEAVTGVGGNEAVGLFAWSNGTIKDLTIDGANVSGSHWVGTLVGYLAAGTVENCTVKNAVVKSTYKDADRDGDKAGAVIGYVNGGEAQPTVSNCKAESCQVSAVRDAGQVIGCAATSQVTNCSATDVTVSYDGTNVPDTYDTSKKGQNINNTIIGR